MLLLLIITGGHTHLIMDIHLPDIMEIMDILDIMAIGTTHLTDIMGIPDIMAIGTILIMGTEVMVIRVANMAAE
jgi:hypothetical protein